MGRMSHTDDDFWAALAAELRGRGIARHPGHPRTLGGGSVHRAARLDTEAAPVFVKRNVAACADMFAAEAEALAALAAAGGVRVPAPLAHGTLAGQAYLVTEFVEPAGSAGDPAAFGRGLARLHACRAEAFGWPRDNYIGTTPQRNGWCGTWPRFWRERRLGHQLDLAERDGHGRVADRGRRLAERVDDLLADHAPAASLLHGDLWGGNHGYDRGGVGVVFDPASYYGDREADLAMTRLFDRLPAPFYRGYEAEWPLPAGHDVRATLYNLYHVLNHAHLFGGGYVAQAAGMIESLLAETGGQGRSD